MNKNFVLVLSGALLMAACGNNSGDTKSTANADTATIAAPAATAASDKGLELIGASDCTTCHTLHKGTGSNIGPAYEDVAAKYSPAADSTVSRIVSKIISGGNGIWGPVPMTPHPALKVDDVHTMVTYILSLKK
jgi:cytochrome c